MSGKLPVAPLADEGGGRRGGNSWRIKFDLAPGPDGKRRSRFVTFRGSKKEAEAKRIELLAAVGKGMFVEPSKLTVIEHVRARLKQWKSAGDIGDKTHERYSELVENQIARFPIAAIKLQALKPVDVEAWHTDLRENGSVRGGGISARTIGHAHKVLSKALREAVKFDLASRNAASKEGQTAPTVDADDVEIIDAKRLPGMLSKLKGRAIFPKAVTALFTGLRRGELLALRWSRTDLDGKVIQVCEALEETKAGVAFKAPKTKAGVRDVTLPDVVVDALREHRRQLLEQRMALGLGRLPDDALVFPALTGGPSAPRQLSGDWREVREVAGVGDVTWHALRHMHVSMLIDAGIDVVKIAKRIGHANPSIALKIYAKEFRKRDEVLAAAINAALAGLGQ